MAQRSQPSPAQSRSTADKAAVLKLTPVSRETGRQLVFLRSDLALCLLSAPTPTIPRKREREQEASGANSKQDVSPPAVEVSAVLPV